MMTVRPRQPIQFAQMVVALCLALAGVPCYAASGDTSTSWDFDAVTAGTCPTGSSSADSTMAVQQVIGRYLKRGCDQRAACPGATLG